VLPVLYHLSGNDAVSTAVVYILALLIFLYALWTGWSSTAPAQGALKAAAEGATTDAAKGSAKSAAKGAAKSAAKNSAEGADRMWPVFRNGAIGLAIAGFGLWYILPEVPLLGQTKGAGLPIPGYGVLVALGFVAGTFLISQLAGWEWLGEEGPKRKQQMLDLVFHIFIGAMVGARLLYVLVNLGDYAKNPLSIFSLQGGLVFYGGLIGGAVAAFFFAQRHHIPFLRLADMAMPAVSLGQCLGRLGCFAASCCHGRIVGEGSAWGVHFPGTHLTDLAGNPSPVLSQAFLAHTRDARWVDLATGKISEAMGPELVRISAWATQHNQSLPVHPVQLYEAAGQLVLFLLLLSMRSLRKFHGQIFGIWLLCYALLRSTLELFRGELERGTLHKLLVELNMPALAAKVPLEAWYNISTSQVISLGMAIFGAWVLVQGWKKRAALFATA
jgi:phosphatidylglycerol:prolipoprotein diacylglycerol transferase